MKLESDVEIRNKASVCENVECSECDKSIPGKEVDYVLTDSLAANYVWFCFSISSGGYLFSSAMVQKPSLLSLCVS